MSVVTERSAAANTFVTIWTVPAGVTFYMTGVSVALQGTTVANSPVEIWLNYGSASDVEAFLPAGATGAFTLTRDFTGEPIPIPAGQAILAVSSGVSPASIDATVRGYTR